MTVLTKINDGGRLAHRVSRAVTRLTSARVVIFGIVLGLASVAWLQWIHAAVFSAHDDSTAGFFVHWLRDGLLAVPVGILAVAFGLWLAERRDGRVDADGPSLIGQTLLISGAFVVLTVPMVAVHTLIDSWIGGSGGLGALRAAPGAGYLDALTDNSFEASSGLVAMLVHGARDAILALVVAAPLVAIGLVVMHGWAAESARTAGSVASPAPISRREMLRYSGAGAVALALSSTGVIVVPSRRAHAATANDVTPWLIDSIELFMNDGTVSMIDGVPVYMLGYGFRSGPVSDADGLHTPGPVIWTHQGDTVSLTVTNNLSAPHSFVIDGVVDSGPIAPGATKIVSFTAPTAGTYLYQDGVNRPVNRVLGLNGTMIVMPSDGSSRLHPSMSAAHWTFDSQWVWMFNQIDPRFNALAQAGRPISGADMRRRFSPRYFTINGRMGSLAAHSETAPDTVAHDTIGNPALIRIVNAGLATHSPHIHGNHVYVLADNAGLLDTIMWKDTMMVKPEDRKDVFLPFNIPPNAVRWPPDPKGSAFLEELHGRKMEGKWPMHCHIEMSQTAGGGLYPQGLLTDWTIDL